MLFYLLTPWTKSQTVTIQVTAQVAQAHYESPEQHYPTWLINYSYSTKIIRLCMEKYSLLTKLAKCTLNIALKLTFSVFLFVFVFWLHFRPPKHCLRPFFERQFFTQMTVERREVKTLLSTVAKSELEAGVVRLTAIGGVCTPTLQNCISLFLFLVHPCPFSSFPCTITRHAINYFVRRWTRLYE